MLPDLLRPHPANVPGACYLQLVPIENVATVPAEVRGTIATAITLTGGSQWVTIEPTRFTQAFTESWVQDQGARVARAVLEYVVPKDRVALLDELYELGVGRYLVLHWDMNGTCKLLGTKKEPCMVRVEQLEHGRGVKAGDSNQYKLRIDMTRRRMCPFYLADPPEADPTACATLEELMAVQSGDYLLALMTDAQIEDLVNSLNVFTMWGYLTPTQQVSTGHIAIALLDGADIWDWMDDTQRAAALNSVTGSSVMSLMEVLQQTQAINSLTGAEVWARANGTVQAAILAAAGVITFSGIQDSGPPYTNSLVNP